MTSRKLTTEAVKGSMRNAPFVARCWQQLSEGAFRFVPGRSTYDVSFDQLPRASYAARHDRGTIGIPTRSPVSPPGHFSYGGAAGLSCTPGRLPRMAAGPVLVIENRFGHTYQCAVAERDPGRVFPPHAVFRLDRLPRRRRSYILALRFAHEMYEPSGTALPWTTSNHDARAIGTRRPVRLLRRPRPPPGR